MYNNFAVERLGIEPHELGYVEALRETSGFLNAFFIALMMRLAPPVVAGVSLVVMGAGLAAYADVHTVFSLAVYSALWGIGFHCWIPMEQSMALRFSPEGRKGKWLGRLRSVHAFAWLLTIGVCNLVFHMARYDWLFAAAGAITVLGGLTIFFASRKRPEVREKSFVFHRRYGLYYALNFLQGCRKQMFITFAIFALVKVHGMPVETTMVLVLINQTLITLTAPLMGRLVDTHGERAVLSWSYIGLAFVFFGYGAIQHRPTLYVLYCVDNLIFFGGIALTTLPAQDRASGGPEAHAVHGRYNESFRRRGGAACGRAGLALLRLPGDLFQRRGSGSCLTGGEPVGGSRGDAATGA